MIPFELVEPQTFREALSLLDAEDPTVRPISGGTALMLMMKSGMFEPTRLVSLRSVESRFSEIWTAPDGALHIGALTRLAVVERSEAVRRNAPVITRTMRTLSNIRVRNVATIGGNLAHGDPHMDLPPVLIALGASVVVHGPSGERTIALEDLFTGYYETVLARDELIGELVIPPQGKKRATYLKCTTRSADDWPALGVAVSLDMHGDVIRDLRVAVSAATPMATRLTATEDVLRGASLGEATLKQAGEAAAEEASILTDAQGTAAYKRHLLRVYMARALRQASDQASELTPATKAQR
jgi:carbon-monoxide dehydrogenase medium subunit